MFITIEGCEGAGKSSIAKALKEQLESNGYKVVLTREPGGTAISEKIRDILLDPMNFDMEPTTEALLYAAARAQHYYTKIKKLEYEGYIVICDRYLSSSLAYQGFARDLGIEEVAQINDFALCGNRPDLELFIDVPPQEAFNRIKAKDKDRMEREDISFHNKVYQYFKENKPAYSITIDGLKPLNQVIENCGRIVLEFVRDAK